jgi:zinc ribbon protein
MALKPCRECGHEVSGSAKACPNCGAPVRTKMGCGTLLLALIFIISVLGIISSLSRTHSTKKTPQKIAKNKNQSKPAACAQVDGTAFDQELVESAQNGYRNIYVNRAWYLMSLDEKQGVARYFSNCRSEGEFSIFYDAFTGKKLAKYGNAWGYSNYED